MFSKYVLFKKAPKQNGGCLDTLDTPQIPHCDPSTKRGTLRETFCSTPQHNRQVIAPGPARRYAPADGSLTRGGSASVRGRVRSLHISGGRPAAGSQRAYSLGWDRQTDFGIA